MIRALQQSAGAFALLFGLAYATTMAQPSNPLPSWNDGATKRAVTDFVRRVTTSGSPDFVPVAERIATFDNDGTLWAEMPLYFQVMFAVDRAKALAARHPTTGQLYTQMVYQPMLELLGYLRANGFKTYIVSGGGVDFMRAFSERVYGIPPEQVIGSTGELKFETRNGVPTMNKLAALDFFDDKDAKAVAIQRHIGHRPIAAFGNSDGDLQMLQWTCAGPGARYCLFVRHTDAEREFAYDKSPMGVLDAGLKDAAAKGWTVVDMKNDWNTIYPFQKK